MLINVQFSSMNRQIFLERGIATLIIIILIEMILRLIVSFRSLNLSFLFAMKSLGVHRTMLSSLHDFSSFRGDCLVHYHLTNRNWVSNRIIRGPCSCEFVITDWPCHLRDFDFDPLKAAVSIVRFPKSLVNDPFVISGATLAALSPPSALHSDYISVLLEFLVFFLLGLFGKCSLLIF